MAGPLVAVSVRGLAPWMAPRTLLGPGDWVIEGPIARATLTAFAAADLDARLRNLAIGGSAIHLETSPVLGRALVRAARTTDARRRRETTPGFTRPGVRLDDEGRVSLTPEDLAFALGKRVGAARVLDVCCGAGGNAIGFARAGASVTAVDQHAGRLADARHNAGVYGVNVEFVRGEAGAYAGRCDADVLFCDPPWGVRWARDGVGVLDLHPLADVLRHVSRVRRVILKVPPSFKVAELPDFKPEPVFGLANGDARRVKFLWMWWAP